MPTVARQSVDHGHTRLYSAQFKRFARMPGLHLKRLRFQNLLEALGDQIEGGVNSGSLCSLGLVAATRFIIGRRQPFNAAISITNAR